jgi:hypothetical protein
MDSDHDKIVALEVRVNGMKENITLQAREYERRLGELNHAHEKQVQDQATYISEDKFAGYVAETALWQKQVSETLAELKGRRSLVAQILPWFIALIGLAVAFLERYNPHS